MSNVKSQRINMEYVNLMKLKINWSIVTLNTNSKKPTLTLLFHSFFTPQQQ